MRLHLVRLLAAACALGVTACTGGGASTSGFASSPVTPGTPLPGSPNVTPASGKAYLGAFVNAGTGGSDAQRIAAFETQVGRRMALSMHYYGWTSDFPNGNEFADAQNGRIPVISWNCGVSNAAVASGSQDANIAAHAQAMRAYGRPIFLRYLWEFNLPVSANSRAQCYDAGTDNADGTFSPVRFVAAWNHIRAVFAAQGVTNVVWLWNPAAGGGDQSAYYPGAAQVDWAGIDEYDRSDVGFVDTFALYGYEASLGKPILIAETGANAALQPVFLAGAAPALQSAFPSIRGFMYFDATGKYDWRLTPAGIAAFAALGQTAVFSP